MYLVILYINVKLFYLRLIFLTISVINFCSRKVLYCRSRLEKTQKQQNRLLMMVYKKRSDMYVSFWFYFFSIWHFMFLLFYSNWIFDLFILYSICDMIINIIVLNLFFASLSQYCILFIIGKFVNNCIAAFVVFWIN